MVQPDLSTLQSWHEKDNFEKIVNYLEQIPSSKRDYELDSHLARAYNNLSRYKEALRLLERYAVEGEQDPLWHFRIGYAYFYQGQYEGAIPAFERVLQLDPDDDTAEYLLTQSRSEQHRNSSSSANMRHATGDSPSDVADESMRPLLPFLWVDLSDGRATVILNVGSYRADLFLERQDEGFEGNGYDWASLAQVFLEEQMPELADIVRFDPEGDMYAVYSDDKDALLRFSLAFKSACDDDVTFRDLFSRTQEL